MVHDRVTRETSSGAACSSRFVWCQAQFALPIDERVLAQILEIDWESTGEFYEY